MSTECKTKSGHILVEVLLAIGIFTVIASAVLGGFISVRDGKVSQKQTLLANGYLDQAVEALRSIKEREGGWGLLSTAGMYHVVLNGSSWGLRDGQEDVDGFIRKVDIANVCRNKTSGLVVASCLEANAVNDPSVRRITVTVSWGLLDRQKTEVSYYITRYGENNISIDTSQNDFQAGQDFNTNRTHSAGEVVLANNTNARWCSPKLLKDSSDREITITLPDGPPVAVAARSSVTDVSIPNDVLVATAPSTGSSIKLAYVNVTADEEVPETTLRGVFTLDPSKGNIQTGINLDNSFKTNDVKYYTSASGKLYALLAIDKPDKEVIAILVNDNNDSSNSEYQDFTNKIYKYWTFFNTRIYQGNSSSTPNQDRAPFGSGAVSLAVFGDRGYALSGGYLYVFNLANIDSKSTSTGLDMVGCRIQLDGYDCNPGSPASDKKYSSGQTGSSWGDTGSPAHNDCSDGGNIERFADNDLDVVQVGSSIYVFVAVGAGTDPELNIVNVTSVPTSSSSPKISNSSCGRISGGNSGWRRVGSLDFNSKSGTEEAANSVYAKADGTRAYISSNGGIDANDDGLPDSKQFYIVNTSSKSSPAFLSGSSGSPSYGPTSGFYYGTSPNDELYPRRSLTVLNGLRAVLVGRDGASNSDDADEYQVLKMDGDGSEGSPKYCGGVNFDSGFNDLVSVVEKDGDSFVYMVADTQEKQLKIIQGGEDGTYMPEGYFEGEPYDAGADKTVMFNRIVANVSVPGGTSLIFKVATYGDGTKACDTITPTFVGPAGTAGDDDNYTTSGQISYFDLPSTNQNPARCFNYRAAFTSDSSRDLTPVLNSFTVNYSP